MISRLVSILLLLCFCSIVTNVNAQEDTFTDKGEIEYEGYRLDVRTIEVIKQKKATVNLNFVVYNTGSKNLSLGNPSKLPKNLIINFDDSFKEGKYAKLEPFITNYIKSNKRNIEASKKSIYNKVKITTPKDLLKESENTFKTNIQNRFIKKDLCANLIIDSIYLIRRKKNYIEIGYQIRNTGKGSVSIDGNPKDPYDNIGISAYFSGTKNLSRGSISVGNFYISDIPDGQKGILFPGDSFQGKLKLDTRKKTRFSTVLILFIDSQQVLIECDEKDNLQHFIIR